MKTYKDLAKLLREMVDTSLVLNFEYDEVRDRLKNIKYYSSDALFEIYSYIRNEYEKELRSNGQIDFSGMINQTIPIIKNGEFKSPWKYILVDEFQDISSVRAELVKVLLESNPGSSLFAVGDDWQSIYRFSGAKIQLITRFKEYFGSHTVTKLEKTFRYNNSIAEVAGRFVMKKF